MSVGKNGDINTIYNVGKMQQAQKNRSNSTNRGFKDPNGNNTASSRISSINSIPPQKKDVNTTTKYSIQESENNSGSFSMDNQGRTLSKEQQEYFKDSKVRDENGNLITMYHGTDAEFNEFTYENYGKTGTAVIVLY